MSGVVEEGGGSGMRWGWVGVAWYAIQGKGFSLDPAFLG